MRFGGYKITTSSFTWVTDPLACNQTLAFRSTEGGIKSHFVNSSDRRPPDPAFFSFEGGDVPAVPPLPLCGDENIE